MADLRNYQSRVQTGEMIDQGLRAYMLKVYNLMALGLAITGVAAYLGFNFAVQDGQLTQFGALLFQSPLRWVVILAPLAVVFFLSFRIHQMSVSAAQTTFWIYAGLVGLSLSSIFLVYTGQSVVQTFFVTAASFGALSLYGYTAKRDLSAMGSFLIMGLFGLIIASLVNIFLASSALQFAISVIGVLIFAGLTAYDTQRIKELYFEADDVAVAGRKAIMGALTLYLDFLNLFMFLLQFMGNRR
ncbi:MULTISPECIES: Bax inhibitor-1/YccA family protein [Rhizobium]|uniref:Bax inhibitor-1/YccA family protein n=1 Tax=Rhizobium TaxID=379 RepID=UPI0007EAADA0|nr:MULTISPECIES: Bax inhibitor-1/YccA family protein [Rhizobium]ANK87583.1 inhibitor of apoptosis-promoting Bax1-related protein [Rhizobium sp. N731]ANK93528.1 inhibitor of apoptosis-promoting Bax1-related protein [Rhizobium sp. N6212]ANK99574.1 inhibitor of apoptosis-promoting Bax1-related protein [Rhizobium sp. N621]ANL05704.1 inhibitor of apoptosis-promoting Bax1-related protein [Rhizobium esperanzae]ANL11758.1 inhibitor of apoptosis-promoting Bax1-related protein [Rhizobium sp. N1341]